MVPNPAHSGCESWLQSVWAVGGHLSRYPVGGVAYSAPGTCTQLTPQTTVNLVVHGGVPNSPAQPVLEHAAAPTSSAPISTVSKRARGGGRSPGSPWQLAICW